MIKYWLITGDTHGEFGNVAHFCEQAQMEKSDILIILGDAGINYVTFYDR